MKRSSNTHRQQRQQPTIFGGGFPIPQPPAVQPADFAPADLPEPANDRGTPYKESLLVKRRRRRNRLAGRHH
ncbi:MAG: hypothetical protein AAF583_16040 [Pseudomonadota bacterium]